MRTHIRTHDDDAPAPRTDVRGFPRELARMIKREEYIMPSVVDAVIADLEMRDSLPSTDDGEWLAFVSRIWR